MPFLFLFSPAEAEEDAPTAVLCFALLTAFVSAILGFVLMDRCSSNDACCTAFLAFDVNFLWACIELLFSFVLLTNFDTLLICSLKIATAVSSEPIIIAALLDLFVSVFVASTKLLTLSRRRTPSSALPAIYGRYQFSPRRWVYMSEAVALESKDGSTAAVATVAEVLAAVADDITTAVAEEWHWKLVYSTANGVPTWTQH
jgi:hypothetical protein